LLLAANTQNRLTLKGKGDDRGLKEILPTTGKSARRQKSRAVKFCPRCGSTDVFWAQGLPQLWSIWQCHNCGYQGPVILEDGKTAEKIQEKWRKQTHPTNP